MASDEARGTKLVSEARAKVLLQDIMRVSEEAMETIWEGMSVQEVEARIGMRMKMELDGDAVAVTDHLVATAASIYGVGCLCRTLTGWWGSWMRRSAIG